MTRAYNVTLASTGTKKAWDQPAVRCVTQDRHSLFMVVDCAMIVMKAGTLQALPAAFVKTAHQVSIKIHKAQSFVASVSEASISPIRHSQCIGCPTGYHN